MAEESQLGNTCKLFLASTPGGSYQEMTRAKDVDLAVDATEVDTTTRQDGGWKGRRGGLKSFTVTGSFKYVSTDTVWSTFRTAYINGTQVGVKVLTEAATGGFSGPARILNWTRHEPLDDIITVDFTIVSDGAPSWI